MSSLARKYQQQEQTEQTVQSTKQLIIKKSWLTPGEKIIGVAFAGMVCLGAVQLITNQTKIYEVNKSIQNVEAKVNEQQKVNSDLRVQVSELSSYERIKREAEKMGLEWNGTNVKDVAGR
ncbi:cell division protein FtsL [Neobacillus soli]|uniref:cell division protein FtsL n=1 Tax=Neobacillus soli TaxID=220688 RepID=UPI0008251733|nr:cell division protein FtsL [Neobacillus soli]